MSGCVICSRSISSRSSRTLEEVSDGTRCILRSWIPHGTETIQPKEKVCLPCWKRAYRHLRSLSQDYQKSCSIKPSQPAAVTNEPQETSEVREPSNATRVKTYQGPKQRRRPCINKQNEFSPASRDDKNTSEPLPPMKCVVRGCTTTTEDNHAMFGFPSKQELYLQWLVAIDRKDLINEKTRVVSDSAVYCICARHFEKKYFFKDTADKFVKYDAIPSLYLPCETVRIKEEVSLDNIAIKLENVEENTDEIKDGQSSDILSKEVDSDNDISSLETGLKIEPMDEDEQQTRRQLDEKPAEEIEANSEYNAGDEDIEDILRRLENGEDSDDGMESDGDDLLYYTPYEEFVRELDSQLGDDVFDEVTTADDGEDPPWIQGDAESNIQSPLPDTSSQLPAFSINSSRNLGWKKQSLVFNKIKFGDSEELTAAVMEMQTPYQFFSYFFSYDLIEKIVTETNRYAVQTQPDRPESLSVSDLRKFIGILIFTSVYHYPSIRSLWSTKFGFSPIKYAMTINKFENIRKILHFNNNENHLPVSHPQHDKLHKLRPVIDYLNQTFSSLTIDQRLSVDEQMSSTKIGHFHEQYLPNKPHKWGFKLLVLRNLMGYAYRFQIYAEKEADERLPNESDVGLVGQTVLELLSVVPRQQNHIVYFNNYNTSLPLMRVIAKDGIHTAGTIQRNRLGKSCKLPTKQDVMKNSVPRGAFEEYVTNFEGVDISTVSWKDNKQVVLASTYVGAQPVENIDRFDKKEKRRIPITCPKVIKEYDAHIGGVDLMDSYLGRYRIRMKSRKWYLRIFYHLLDLSVINSWILYKKVSNKYGVPPKNILSLADFGSELADTLCKHAPIDSRYRPSTSSPFRTSAEPAPKIQRGKPCQTLPPLEVRLDKIDHCQIRPGSRGRCMMPSCFLLSCIKCAKCNVHLCAKKYKDCFTVFHNSVII